MLKDLIKMDERTRNILEAIIREYIDTASPVGSFALREHFEFPFSPATIRSIMSDLEEAGFIFQPHTSAGRVPTERGYRFFIDLLEGDYSLVPQRELLALKKRILSLKSSYERMLEASAKLLTEVSSNAGIVGSGDQVFKYGISNLLRKPESRNKRYALGAAEMFDGIEDFAREIPDDIETEVYIGEESPIGKDAGLSFVISKFKTPCDTRGFLGILGPTRMSYDKNISLVGFVKEILEEVR